MNKKSIVDDKNDRLITAVQQATGDTTAAAT